jgi:thioredoxin 1
MNKIGLIIGIFVTVGLILGIFTQRSRYFTSNLDQKLVTESVEHGVYVNYSEIALAEASQNGKALLFFKADWCSTCSVLDKELINETGELPEGLTVLKASYDKEKELKKKYQVTIQHTLVQVNKEGEEIKKWVGGGIETINQQLI